MNRRTAEHYSNIEAQLQTYDIAYAMPISEDTARSLRSLQPTTIPLGNDGFNGPNGAFIIVPDKTPITPAKAGGAMSAIVLGDIVEGGERHVYVDDRAKFYVRQAQNRRTAKEIISTLARPQDINFELILVHSGSQAE
jgi:hypothetical protein